MASPDVLDFEKLLAPIPGENPAGAALREHRSPTAAYDRVKDARTAAREVERNIVFDDEAGSSRAADWRPILKLCQGVLAEESKDLEVVAWLIEALVREHSFAGLRDGFRLVRELVQRYWDQLYPLPDEDGLVTRVAPLAGLNGVDADGVLVSPIFNAPVTKAGSYRALSVSDYRQAIDLDRVDDPEKRENRLSQGAVSMQMFERAVSEAGPQFFADLMEDINQCMQEYAGLCEVLEEKCGQGEGGYPLAPPSSNIRNALLACKETVESAAGPLLQTEPPPEGEGEEDGRAMVHVPEGSGVAMRRVQTREEAFRALLQVAEFFKRTEPHSPVSYALEQAVRWGRMSLPDLLGELVEDPAVRAQIFRLVGIPDREGNE